MGQKRKDYIFEDDPLNFEGFETVRLNDWFSVSVMISDEKSGMKCVNELADLMESLVREEKINKWFFLYEGTLLAARMQTDLTKGKIKRALFARSKKFEIDFNQNSFCTYKEKKGKMFNETVMLAFANIMCETTSLWLKKREHQTNFSNYRLMERISHCMYNVLCGSFVHSIKDEKYFLHQRILERDRSFFDDQFEDYDMPKVKLKAYYG